MDARKEAVSKFRHEISGHILDVFHGDPRGAELSVKMRALLKAIDEAAGKFYDSIVPLKPLERKPT